MKCSIFIDVKEFYIFAFLSILLARVIMWNYVTPGLLFWESLESLEYNAPAPSVDENNSKADSHLQVTEATSAVWTEPEDKADHTKVDNSEDIMPDPYEGIDFEEIIEATALATDEIKCLKVSNIVCIWCVVITCPNSY